MPFWSAIARSVQPGIGAAVGLPAGAPGVVVPAGEAEAALAVAVVVLELSPWTRNAEVHPRLLRRAPILVPVVGRLALAALLVDHAARGAIVAPRHAVGREDPRRHRLHLRDLLILAVELERGPLEERLEPRLEQLLVLLDPEAVVPGHEVAGAGLGLRLRVLSADEIALVDVDWGLAALERDLVADVADQPVVREPAGVVAHADLAQRRFLA